MTSKRYFYGLDYLRVFFTVAVVMWHTKLLGLTSTTAQTPLLFKLTIREVIYYNIFNVAVPFFFQAALVLYIFNRESKGPDYVIKRVKDLGLIYIMGITISSIINPNVFWTANDSLLSAMQFIISGASTHIYFIINLMMLTLIVEIIYRIRDKFSSDSFLLFLFFGLIFSCIILTLRIPFATVLEFHPYTWFFMSYRNLINFIPYIFSAYLIVILFKENKIRVNHYYILFATLIYILLVALEWRYLPNEINKIYDSVFIPTYARISVVWASINLTALFLLPRNKPSKIITLTSKLSLSIYFIHYFLIQLIYKANPFYMDIIAANNWFILYSFLILVGSFLLSYLWILLLRGYSLRENTK